jgi:hypothetical protein
MSLSSSFTTTTPIRSGRHRRGRRRAFIHGLHRSFETTPTSSGVAEEYADALVSRFVDRAEIRAADDHARSRSSGDRRQHVDFRMTRTSTCAAVERHHADRLHTAVLTAFSDAAGRFNVNMAEDLSAHKDDFCAWAQPCRKRNWATAMAGGCHGAGRMGDDEGCRATRGLASRGKSASSNDELQRDDATR